MWLLKQVCLISESSAFRGSVKGFETYFNTRNPEAIGVVPQTRPARSVYNDAEDVLIGCQV